MDDGKTVGRDAVIGRGGGDHGRALATQHAPKHEQEIGRPRRQTTHIPGEPLGAEANQCTPQERAPSQPHHTRCRGSTNVRAARASSLAASRRVSRRALEPSPRSDGLVDGARQAAQASSIATRATATG